MMPRTATPFGVWVAGLVAFLVAFGWVMFARPFGVNAVWSSLLVMGCSGGVMFASELMVRARRYPGLFAWRPCPGALRIASYQYVGLLGYLSALAAFYWLFAEYRGGWYAGYFYGVLVCVCGWLLLALPYFWLVARWLPFDDCGLFHLGWLIVHGRFVPGGAAVIRMAALSWLVRGFFLPLMWVYFLQDLERYFRFGLPSEFSMLWFYQQAMDGLYTLDVGFVCVGYLCGSRLVGTHAKSTDLTLRGWVVAVVCYQPVWGLFGRLYLAYQLPRYDWWTWLAQYPVAAALWGSCIVALTAVYVWATLVFGPRFSNLSNKGVITSGPYRWHRHPAYICKNLSWWLISVPWMASGGWLEGLRHCVLLLGVNAIYAARAWTEEVHMRQDPAYRAYAAWVDQNGLVARLRAWVRPARDGVAV